MPRDETKSNLRSSRRDISKEMRDSFHLKGLRRLAELGLKGHHKLDALKVINHYEHAREIEKADFKDNFKTRVHKTIERLQREDGAKTIELNPPFAFIDRFNNARLTTQAKKEVRQAHEVTLSLLDRQETRELESIARQAGRGDIDPELLSKDFDRASDRRSKPERRIQMQSRLRSRVRSR